MRQWILAASGKDHGFLDTILPYPSVDGIHVIEYSAYEKLKTALEMIAKDCEQEERYAAQVARMALGTPDEKTKDK